jgi:hypothetical protein
MNREKLIEEIKVNAIVMHATQRQPYTCVLLRFEYETGHFFFGGGFSKANWPDKFDDNFGLELAYNRAVGDIVQQVKAYLNEQENEELEQTRYLV